jgi:predicted DNA-binding protein
MEHAMKCEQIAIRFNAETLQRIEAEARRERRTRSDMIRLLVEDGLTVKLDTTAGQAKELAQALRGKR